MRVESTYPTPIQGVSTLSPRNRARGQMEVQDNFRSDPVNKLTRRQSLVWKKKLIDYTGDNLKFHSYNRNGKNFKILVANSRIHMFVDDNEITVNNNDLHIPYLTGSNIRVSTLHTINDTTVLVNRSKKVLMEEVVDDVPKASHINVISALNYGETITIKITIVDPVNGTQSFTAQHVVPNIGTNPPNYDIADKARATARVAESLTSQINQIASGNIGWDCDEYGVCTPITGPSYAIEAYNKGSVIGVRNLEGNNKLTIEVLAGQGTRSCVAINEENSSIEGLPLYAIPNTTIIIKPNPTTDKGTYYLKAVPVSDLTSSDTMREVTWVESRKQEDIHRFVDTTLPLEIFYNQATNQATVSHMMLKERKVGDSETNKAPAFVNNTITAISYFQKRLVVVSNNDVSMSETDDIYDFFKKSSVQLLVTDPIGIASTYTEVDVIKHVIPHNRDLMFVASNGQFKIPGDVAVSPQTVSMPMTSTYECTTDVPPVSIGNSVLIPISYGTSAGLQEYRREKNVDTDVAHPLTHHVIGYMKGNITHMVANGNLEMCMLTTSESGLNEIFVYEQYSEFGEHRQRSWSRWVLPTGDRILGMDFVNNRLDLIVRNAGVVYLKQIELYTNVTDTSKDTFLDDKITVTTGNTIAVLPPHYKWSDDLVIVMGDRSRYPLQEVKDYTVDTTGTSVVLLFKETITSHADCEISIGRRFKSTFIPTRPFRYTENNIAITTDRVRVARFIVNVVDTGELNMNILSEFYDSETQRFNARIVGGLQNLVGKQPLYTGDVKFSFSQDANLAKAEFFTDTFLNLTVSGLSWSGQYHEASQRM